MAPRGRRSPGAVLLRPQQVSPRHYREPVSCSRQARSAYKTQPFAIVFDGSAHVSAHDALRDHGRCDRSDGSFTADRVLDLQGSRRDNKWERYAYRKTAPACVRGFRCYDNGDMGVAGYFCCDISGFEAGSFSVLGTAVYAGYMWWARKEMFYEIRELIGRKWLTRNWRGTLSAWGRCGSFWCLLWLVWLHWDRLRQEIYHIININLRFVKMGRNHSKSALFDRINNNKNPMQQICVTYIQFLNIYYRDDRYPRKSLYFQFHLSRKQEQMMCLYEPSLSLSYHVVTAYNDGGH